MTAARRYAAVQNTTASKERLMVQLFETAVRHMRNAIHELEGRQTRPAMTLIKKASDIVAYLHGTLKRDEAPKLVDDLSEIYTFTLARLARSMVTAKASDVREAERAFAPVAEGFAQAVAAAATTQPRLAAVK